MKDLYENIPPYIPFLKKTANGTNFSNLKSPFFFTRMSDSFSTPIVYQKFALNFLIILVKPFTVANFCFSNRNANVYSRFIGFGATLS